MIFQRKIHQINSPTLRSVVGGEGESLREGEGSDFAIQAPSPSLKKEKNHFRDSNLTENQQYFRISNLFRLALFPQSQDHKAHKPSHQVLFESLEDMLHYQPHLEIFPLARHKLYQIIFQNFQVAFVWG